MENTDPNIPNDTDRELVITRQFTVSRDQLFTVWSESGHLDNWWGPEDFKAETASFDFVEGKSWEFTMTSPYGEFDNTVSYVKIKSPELIVYSLPGGLQTTVYIHEQDGKAFLIMALLFETPAEYREAINKYGATESGNLTLDRLAAYLHKTFAK